ncbi:DUF3921 family protein [Bacillus songklensis]|uniref:DUF3921 family protein n=1 Tax=Bacillus songklensis TaxID=1069116 RepID=A0ABV8B1F6_9BACI
MTKGQVDFSMIHHALQQSYQHLLMSADEVSAATLHELEQAREDLQSALSCATNIDKKYLTYTRTT